MWTGSAVPVVQCRLWFLCAGGESEIKLDSDEEGEGEGDSPSSGDAPQHKESGEYSNPFESPAVPAAAVAAAAAGSGSKEETPQISVSQTSTSSASKLSGTSKNAREEVG